MQFVEQGKNVTLLLFCIVDPETEPAVPDEVAFRHPEIRLHDERSSIPVLICRGKAFAVSPLVTAFLTVDRHLCGKRSDEQQSNRENTKSLHQVHSSISG